jgi:hypothetical protein
VLFKAWILLLTIVGDSSFVVGDSSVLGVIGLKAEDPDEESSGLRFNEGLLIGLGFGEIAFALSLLGDIADGA